MIDCLFDLLTRNKSIRETETLREANIFDDNDQGLYGNRRLFCLSLANDRIRIDNPLLHWRPSEVDRKARQFARDYDLRNQEDHFVKAARILRDPEAWQSVPNLTADEKQALETERSNGFWQQPKELKVTVRLTFKVISEHLALTSTSPDHYTLRCCCRPRMESDSISSSRLPASWATLIRSEGFERRQPQLASTARLGQSAGLSTNWTGCMDLRHCECKRTYHFGIEGIPSGCR